MKTQFIAGLLSLWAIFLLPNAIIAQEVDPADSTGLPGDQFSLAAALELFKKSESPEDFEKRLNSEDNVVNNLDLNEDGEVDYIRVIDNMDATAHALILQVAVSETESQDIAVIEIEKQGEDNAMLQIVGDEDIYGEQVIVEPVDEAVEKSQKSGGGGPSVHLSPDRIIVNVWLWPSVRFMYRPAYVLWVSPWRWHHYPSFWRPWRPHPWRWYHVRVAPFRRHYPIVTTHRVVRAHTVYAPRRTHSTVVHTRTTTVVTNRRGNVVGKKTTTRTSVDNGRRGDRVTRERETTRVTREGRNGRSVSGQKTTTKTTRKRGRN